MKHHKGFIAMSAVLLISASILALTIGSTYIGITQGHTGLLHSQAAQALALSEGCMEDALLKLRSSPSYAGGTITHSTGSCTVTVSGGNPYTITIEATFGKSTRSATVTATRTNKVTITQWKE